MLENINVNLWDLINITTASLDWIILFLVIQLIGNKNVSSAKYIFRIVAILIFMAIINISGIFPNTKIIICMIVGTLFYTLSYEDKIYKCIVINLLFWLGLMVAEAIAISIVVMINKLDSIQVLLNGNLFRVESVIISKVLLFILLILFKYFKLSLEFKPKDMALIGLPVLSNIVSLLLIFEYNLRRSSINKDNIVVLVFAVSLIVLSSIVLLIVIGKIVQDDKIQLEYELINERIKASHKSYENIAEIHNKIKYIYHDLRNHIICIKNYETREEIISYIDDLEIQISDFENFKNTGNKTLDIILSEKIDICKKNNIEFEDSINISKLSFIKDIDLCVIFANALDNAIEACINIDKEIEKIINVKATYINGFAILKFENSKANEIKFVGNQIQTTKNDNKIHGIGLASIKHIVNKYDGEVIVNYSDNEFILKIMIPIKEKGEYINEKDSIEIT